MHPWILAKIQLTFKLLVIGYVLNMIQAVNAYGSDVEIASPFQSNMVIQQNKPFRIWGKVHPGSHVVLEADWAAQLVIVNADSRGYWEGVIPVPKAVRGDFTPHTLTVKINNRETRLTNLLIGEVWVASGQSNMQFALKGVENSSREIAAADYPHIRLLAVHVDFKAQPYDQVTGKWLPCSPETIPDFSAVAYYFARSLYQHLNIPTGIVLSTIGASTAQAWTSRQELEADSVLYHQYLKPYDDNPKSKEVLTPQVTFEKVAYPTLLYNAMIHPLAGLSIRGFIWYQGESNWKERTTYPRLLSHMIRGWRKDFKQGPLPFYMVQLPPYTIKKGENAMSDGWAYFREAQSRVRELANTEIVVTMDDDEITNLHPKKKEPVGLRLARIALHKDYGDNRIPYLGPQIKKIRISKNTIKVLYKRESLGRGLTTSDNQPPRQFFIAGEDGVFYEAKAKISGKKIILYPGSTARPVAVRYAFTNSAVTNLTNLAGLPAEPFRTDTWTTLHD